MSLYSAETSENESSKELSNHFKDFSTETKVNRQNSVETQDIKSKQGTY